MQKFILQFIFFNFVFCFCTSLLFAQDYVWAQSAGNVKSDKCTSMRTDSLGYIYAAGYFSDSLTLGTNNLGLPNVANANSKEVWLAKYDSTGYCLWAIAGGEYFDDRILGIATDPAGNTVITGTYWQTNAGITIGGLVIGAGPGNGGGDQCFIAKVDPMGNMLWGKMVRSNSGDDQGMDAAFDKQGNIYVCGFMSGNTLIGDGNTLAIDNNTGAQESPYWLTKMDAAGNFLWGKIFGNLPWDTSYGKYIERDIAMCVDENGDAYVTGGFDHTRVFETTNLTSRGSYDGFVIKYLSNGNFVWAKNFGSHKKDWSNGICADRQGHIYITGEHRDSLYFDNQFMAKNYDGRDVFVVKINAIDGSPIWGARAGSNNGGERGNDIVADENCNVYVCGDIDDGAKFGDNIILPVQDGIQSFVARISPVGKWKWALTAGGADDNDRASAIALGVNGQIYSGGFGRTAATFGTMVLPIFGKSDIWIARTHDYSFNKSYGLDLKKPDDLEFCLGGSTKMDIPLNDSLFYNPTDGVSLNAAKTVLIFKSTETTTYTVIASVGQICKDIDTSTFTVVVHPFPKADFKINPNETNIVNPNFSMSNLSSGASSYEWWHEGGLLGTTPDHSFTANKVGDYCFELKAMSAFGCRDSIIHCAKVIEKENFFLPNAFSPNGDLNNDVFIPTITNVDIALLKNYQLIIYDRWGAQVFKTTDVRKGWAGFYKGIPAPMGAYYYLCKYVSPNGEKVILRGDVTLLR